MAQVPEIDEQPLIPLWPDAAELLGMSRTTAYTQARFGVLPVAAFKVAGVWKVRNRDLRQFLGIDDDLPTAS